MANNFVVVKKRYRINKKRGVVLQRTYYVTRYMCGICNRETSVKFEGTKNTDIKMICGNCREMAEYFVKTVGAEKILDILKPAPKTTDEIIKENRKQDKKLAKRIASFIDAGIIPETVLQNAIVEKMRETEK